MKQYVYTCIVGTKTYRNIIYYTIIVQRRWVGAKYIFIRKWHQIVIESTKAKVESQKCKEKG